MKISLDSTVFRNPKFIFWLQRNKDLFTINLSIIVVLETFHWYNLRKISKTTFDKMLNSLGANIVNLNKNQIKTISNNVLKSKLRFKHHSRDIIIASHSIQEEAIVITDNTKHFDWMEKENLTPDELVVLISENSDLVEFP